jgi:hypothetical protein
MKIEIARQLIVELANVGLKKKLNHLGVDTGSELIKLN